MLLQVLEDGVLTDAKGRKIDFSNTIVIMTSNIGADRLQKEAALGFQSSGNGDMEDLDAMHEANKDKVLDALKKMMRPELLNRIDKTIVFRALTKKDILKILDLQLDELRQRLIKHGIGLQLTPAAKDHLLEHGYDAKNGVRPMRRLIQDTLEDHLALELLESRYQKGDIIKVTANREKELSYSVATE